MDLSALLSSPSIAHANPLASLPGLLSPALGTGGGILGSSSSATGAQGNADIFSNAFQVGGRGNSSTANPDVSPSVSTSQTQPASGGGGVVAQALYGDKSSISIILGAVGVLIAVIALVKAH